MELGIEEMFVQSGKSPKFKETTLDDLAAFDKSGQEDTPEMVKRCHHIYHRVLQATDPELYNHIQKSKYDPQLFFVRWLRCILSREFPLNQTLLIWDAMFACHNIESRDIELLNYICASMMIADRDECN